MIVFMKKIAQSKKKLAANQIIEFLKKKDFEFKEELRQGAFGQTVLLHDSEIGEDFVCKKYAPIHEEHKKDFYKNFVQEIKFLYKMFHPNIVRIFNYYLYPDEFTGYILMEHVKGTEISEYIKEQSENINQVFLQTIEGFAYLERNNILHRDIRMQNIMIGEDAAVKIIDFGFGKHAYDDKDFDKSISLNWPFSQPDEFKNDVYNFQTEVYFVGKLFEKLISENQIEHFGYKSILHGMCQTNPEERKKSFASIISEINLNKFLTMNFSEDEIFSYRNFSYILDNLVSKIEYGANYFSDIDKIILKLESLYQNTMLEEYLPKTTLLSNCFIDGSYYTKSINIPVCYIRDFIELLRGSSKEKRNIILSNIHSKLDGIERYTGFNEEEIPF